MAISHINGVALSGLSAINGISSISAINGISATLGGGGSNMVVDLHQTFEFATVDTSSLEANDNNASALWVVFGTAPTTGAGAERATISTVNGSPDTGALGLIIDNDVGGRLQLELAVSPSTQTVGFWFKSSPDANTFNPVYGAGESNSVIDAANICYVKLTDTSGVLTLSLIGSTTSSDVTISAGTWYWVTVKVVSGGTCLLRAYNTSGALVGSEVSATGNANNFFYHIIGGAGTSTGSSNYDDFVVDKDADSYPIGP